MLFTEQGSFWRASSPSVSTIGSCGWRRRIRREVQPGRAGGRLSQDEQREFGESQFALNARFDFGQLKSEQRAFGVDQVEKIEPAGEVSGAGDGERLLGLGQEPPGQQFEGAAGLTKHERLLGKLDCQRDLL